MGTKIFVFRLKTLIKYGVLAFVVIIALITTALLMGGGDKPTYSPGTYSAQIVLNSNPVSVEVTVDKHSIEDIQMLNMGEVEAVFYPVFEQSFDDIAGQVLAMQSTEDVQLDSDNSVTGGIILQAIDAALAKALE